MSIPQRPTPNGSQPRSDIFIFLAIVLGLFLGLAAIEIGMRVAGERIQAKKILASRPDLFQDANEFRIVCIGESTTDDFGYPMHAWPGLLEKKLNDAKLGRKFIVINRGQSGAFSSMIVQHLRDELDVVKPHAVISMMGVNDLSSLEYLHPTGIMNLRILKLAHWIVAALHKPPPPPAELPVDDTWVIHGDFEKTLVPLTHESLEHYKTKVDETLKKYDNVRWQILEIAARQLIFAYNHVEFTPGFSEAVKTETAQLAADYAGQAFDLNPTNRLVVSSVFFAGLHVPDFSRDRLIKSVELGLDVDDFMFSLLSQAEVDDAPAVRNVFHEMGYHRANGKAWFDITMESYRQLADTLLDKHIQYIPMQYPLSTVDSLKNLFSVSPVVDSESYPHSLNTKMPDLKLEAKYADLPFISNENFADAVAGGHYDDYFVDRFTTPFGGKFGHATIKGQELIAQNVADYIIKHWNEISAAASPHE